MAYGNLPPEFYVPPPGSKNLFKIFLEPRKSLFGMGC